MGSAGGYRSSVHRLLHFGWYHLYHNVPYDHTSLIVSKTVKSSADRFIILQFSIIKLFNCAV